ncbi:alpha/beta hydrolase [Aegicerativicinus sediminis]|uniref:alpha/beta hydrolase n=1 Tax=Aegicerativicinus sediminis TaxID=2893202 RepID=UPI001E2AB423|nr:alpha/beta hydrolase [Aegicerativicinus sediminis]
MKNNKRKWSIRKKLRMLWVLAGIAFMLWQFYSMQAHNVENSLMQSDDQLTFHNTSDFYSYTPTAYYNSTLIFFPGALVQPKAYIPLCRNIAENNVKVYLIKMPWRQATMGYNKIKELDILKNSTMTYILAGHSQGGKMAAQFVYENPDAIDKLILIGTTHPRDISLADQTLPILKIYGTNDGVADEATMLKNKPMLPEKTEFKRIEGGNHSQFGYYGFQLGDDKANISRELQQKETLESILEFMDID